MRRLLLGSASLLVVTLAVAACGGDDDDPALSPTGTATSTSTNPTSTTPAGTSPATTATPSPTTADRPASYTVESGDTLTSIADQFGLTVDEILAVNEIPDPDLLEIGQVLTIPSADGGAASPTSPTTQ